MIAGKLLFPTFQSEAVSTDWRDIADSSTSSPGPKSRTQNGKFINHLEDQSQLLVGSCHSLHEELFSPMPRFSLLASKLAVHCTQSKAIDGALTQELCHALITPIDCEDLKRLSHVIHKLTATQLRLAQTFDAAGSSAATYGCLQEAVVHCADALDRAVHSLNSSDLPAECNRLHKNWRLARTALRQMHVQQWASEREVRHRLTEQLLYCEFASELGYIKASYDTLMRARLKNG